jgi:magnesium-transporting ATPase (P-type)
VTEENFVMQGSTIKNAKCVYGLVVYTGMETKIMQIIKNDKNNNANIIKGVRNITSTSLKLIQFLIMLVYIVAILLVTLAYFEKIHFARFKEDHYYLALDKNRSVIDNSITTTTSTYYNECFKPHYTVDIINKDCLADFGKVKYILADKTEKLTARKFILKACFIKGKLYSFDPIDSRKDETEVFRHKDFDVSGLEIYQELK